MSSAGAQRNVHALALVLGAHLVLGSWLGSGGGAFNGFGSLLLGVALLLFAEMIAMSPYRQTFGVLLILLASVVLILPLGINLLWGLFALANGYTHGEFEFGRMGLFLVALAGGAWAALRWASYRIGQQGTIDTTD